MLALKVVVTGLKETENYIKAVQKQARFAAAVALTKTAKVVKEKMPAMMERELDRPTAFTKRGMFVTPAKPGNLTAVVGFMDRQASYLKYQIAGGTRMPTARGIALPGNIILNSFGNIPPGVINKLKAAAQDGSLSKALTRRIGVTGRRKGGKAIELFFGKPTGRGWEKAPMGIWRRVPGSPGKLVPVIVFEDTPAKYRPRFKFHEAAADIVRREWDSQFAAAFAEAMRTAR